MDARHPLTDLDIQLLEWFGPTEKPVHALLTKSDKLSKLECADVLRQVSADLKKMSPLYSASLFSSLKKTGIDQAEAAILPWLETMAMVGPVTHAVPGDTPDEAED
jgi:GTP-binding protein